MSAAAWKGKVDFGIITIREDECAAVLKRFPEKIEAISGHRRYRLRRLTLSPTETYTVAILRCIEQGNGEAHDAARDLLEDLAPRWLFVVGIAGGVPAHEFSLGDVIVSTRIVDFSVEAVLKDHSREYTLAGGPLHRDAAKLAADVRAMVHDGELGNWNDAGTIGRPRPSVEIADDRFYGDDAWKKDVREKMERHFDGKSPRPPLVTTGAIASSDRLIKEAEILGVWLKIARQIQAVEMESSGVYRATQGKDVPFLAIRGISDVVGFKRHHDWTEYACHTAAAFLVAFLRTRPIPPRADERPREAAASHGTADEVKAGSVSLMGHVSAGSGMDGPGRPRQAHARFDASADLLRRAAARVHAGYSFLGLPDSSPKPKATLDNMFVPLSFVRGVEQDEIALRELEPRWIQPAGEGEVATRAVILGAPGSGKSTLCRYLALQSARLEAGPVPLLLTVRSWTAEGTSKGILAAVAREAAATLAARVDEQILAELCAAGMVVLLVDGIDEVSAERRAWLRDCVHGFCETYPRVPVVVTSRTVDYDRAPLDRGFSLLRLEPFDDEQLHDFIEHWYEVAEPDNPTERLRRCSDLQAALEAEPRAKELARNPLLATLIALVHRHQAHLPGERARLYRLCIELLMVTWPVERERALADLDAYWQLARLEELALWMQRRRRSNSYEESDVLLSGADLERRLAELLAVHRDRLDDGHRRSLAVKWRRWLVESSGVMQEFECDRYGFVHLSLMEYLAGRGVIREYGSDGHEAIAAFVEQHHGQGLWVEPLLLMLGSEADNSELSTTVIERLLNLDRSSQNAAFILEMLREEVEFSDSLLARALERVAMTALEDWKTADTLNADLSDVLTFSRAHGSSVREWFHRQLAKRSGRSLLGVLLIAPNEIVPTPEMQARSDEDLGLEELLSLSMASAWGVWAHSRARSTTLLHWSCATPLAGIFLRSVSALLGSREPQIWIASLVRRIAWLFEVLRRAAHELTESQREGAGELGAYMHVSVEGIERRVAVFPAVATSGTTHEVESPFEMLSSHTQNLGGIRGGNGILMLETRLAFLQMGVAEMLDRLRDLAAPASRINVQARREQRPGHWGMGFFPGGSLIEPPAGMSKTVRQQIEPFVLSEASAGLTIGSEVSWTTRAALAEARVHNVWIHQCFDQLTDYIIEWESLTPERHALLLALGLAQYQTTHAWPDSDRWRSWFAINTPPDFWCVAYVWHLCRGIEDPDNPIHFTHADACLERGNWPELIAELRKYPIRPTPSEVLALFGRS